MPFEDDILNLRHDGDDNLEEEEEAMFYEVNKSCNNYFDQLEINSNSTKLGDHSIWKDHTTKERIIYFAVAQMEHGREEKPR